MTNIFTGDLKMNKKLTAIAASVVFLASCAKSPDSEVTKDVIRDAAHAQGGVCLNETFTFIFGERAYGLAKPTKQNEDKSVVLEVQTHKPSKAGLSTRGDSDYKPTVEITDFPLKSNENCTFG